MNHETNLYLTEQLGDFDPAHQIIAWPSPIMKFHEAKQWCRQQAYAKFYRVVGPKMFTDTEAASLLRMYEAMLRCIQWSHVALVMARESQLDLAFQDHQKEIKEKYEAALKKDREPLNIKDIIGEVEEKQKVMALASEQNEK